MDRERVDAPSKAHGGEDVPAAVGSAGRAHGAPVAKGRRRQRRRAPLSAAERRLQRDSKAEFGGTTAWATRVSAPAAQFRWRKVMLARCGDLPIFR